MPRTALWWIRKDFRLHDNPALHAALREADGVVPVFVFEPGVLHAPDLSAFHVAAWMDALDALRAALRPSGGEVLILHGEAPEVFARLHAALGFDSIHSNAVTGTAATRSREAAVAEWCRRAGVAWQQAPQHGVPRGEAASPGDARWRAGMQAPPLPTPDAALLARLHLPPRPAAPGSYDAPLLRTLGFTLSPAMRATRQPVSEPEAQATLHSFLGSRAPGYKGGLGTPLDAEAHGSRLSVHLAWGTTTARAVYHATRLRLAELPPPPAGQAAAWRRALRRFRRRLAWRDAALQAFESRPDLEFFPLQRAYEALPARDDADLLDAWLSGYTGFPLVDAAMRCARTTGFLGFRLRALVTSVACHALRLDWRAIAPPLARLWADYEPAIHFSQLQMQAGFTPRQALRLYDPARQLTLYDPGAQFVKKWVPELARYAPADIAAHQTRPLAGYLPPVVDWRASTDALQRDYFALRRQIETRQAAPRPVVRAAPLPRHG